MNPATQYNKLYFTGYQTAQLDYRNGALCPRYNGQKGDAYNEGYEDGWNDCSTPCNGCTVKELK